MKIAILGSHPETRDLCPFQDDSWRIYACSPHNAPPHFTLPRFDKWFEVHKPAYHKTRDMDYQDYLREVSKTKPVYMRDKSGHPDAILYDEDRHQEEFGPFFMETSSIGFLFADAILDIMDSRPAGVHHNPDDTIGIWGIMQQSAIEFAYQRPGVQHYCTAARDRGIDVLCPEISGVLKPITYDF